MEWLQQVSLQYITTYLHIGLLLNTCTQIYLIVLIADKSRHHVFDVSGSAFRLFTAANRPHIWNLTSEMRSGGLILNLCFL